MFEILVEKPSKKPDDNKSTADFDIFNTDDLECPMDIMDEVSKIKLRLTKSLKILCNQLNISLSYHDYITENALGWIKLRENKIEILKQYKHEPLVLAHELGHYMANIQRNDISELGADREALKLCQSILTLEEQKKLGNYLTEHFTRYEQDKSNN
jgi:hypothetical protein